MQSANFTVADVIGHQKSKHGNAVT